MNKHILKKIRDYMPEFIKSKLGFIFRNQLIKNNDYIDCLDTLKKRETKISSEIKEIQLIKLKQIMVYANMYVPYYQKLFKEIDFDPNSVICFEDIKVIPFLTKEIIRENFEQLKSTESVSGGYYVATTGGSTGEPLKVLLDYNCVFKENAFVNYFRSKLGYIHSDKLATFRGIEFEKRLWKLNPMQNELIFSPFKLSKLNVQSYVDKMNAFKPDYLNGYLSSIYFFARLLSDNSLKLNFKLKGIFLISENIDMVQRAFIEAFFNVPSSTFYGHSERCIIAEEIELNLYAFDPYYGYTELIENDDNTYTIVGTGFLNKTMPLIRYKTDDKCIKKNNDLVQIIGRWLTTDCVIGTNGEKVFHSAFNFHSEIFKNVTGYQFIQKVKGKADLLITVNGQFQKSEISNMQKEIQRKTKDIVEFEIKVVDSLMLSNRGKFKMFISEL